MDVNQGSELIPYGFYGMITVIGGFIATSMNQIKTSIESLNQHVAVLLEKTDRHDKDLDKHATKIEKIEEKLNGANNG